MFHVKHITFCEGELKAKSWSKLQNFPFLLVLLQISHALCLEMMAKKDHLANNKMVYSKIIKPKISHEPNNVLLVFLHEGLFNGIVFVVDSERIPPPIYARACPNAIPSHISFVYKYR